MRERRIEQIYDEAAEASIWTSIIVAMGVGILVVAAVGFLVGYWLVEHGFV